jgi:heme-degrading monooxygenase HmoA
MILERAIYYIKPGTAKQFEKGFAEARQYIERQPGLIRIEMRQGIESPDCFMLLAWWDSVESHMEGFRKSVDFAKWRAPLAPCFSDKPVWMEHFAAEAGDSG